MSSPSAMLSEAAEPTSSRVASPLLRLWGWPLLLGLLSASGLVSDGWGDAWSWFGLGLPVAVMAWYGWRRA